MRPWIAVLVCFKATALGLALGHHRDAALVVFFLPDPWIFLQFILPSQQAFGPAVTAFETDRREVWLTIDDGPDPASTPQVLELLRRHGARATFFVIGEQVEKHPGLARQIVAEGHTVGNHTHTHPSPSFWCASPARTASEIERCVAALLLADVPFERYFRPPVGIRNPFLDPQLSSRGMQLVLWNARGLDGRGGSPQAALARITRRIEPGGILVSHEAGPRAANRVEFVQLLLEHLTSEGYACVLPPRDALVCDS
ncbi:MAG TPA: polysaccharide deacetylase family protein [Opitutaceae bacterium]